MRPAIHHTHTPAAAWVLEKEISDTRAWNTYTHIHTHTETLNIDVMLTQSSSCLTIQITKGALCENKCFLPATETPEDHICLCCHLKWRTVYPGCPEETEEIATC